MSGALLAPSGSGLEAPSAARSEFLASRAEWDENLLPGIGEHAQAFEDDSARRFADALAGFEAVGQAFGQGPVGAALAARRRRFLEQPPPDDWDGLRDLVEK